MNIKSSICVYPSYKGIQKNIQQKYLQKYQRKISSLKSHLGDLQAKHHFEKDHEKIQNSILTLSTQNPHYQNNQDKDAVKLKHEKKGSCLSSYHGESLNYYIEDDGEEESNYQTYLKFKKKTLERDLEEEQMSQLGLNRRQREEEEMFFKNLYVPQQYKEGLIKRKGSSLKKSDNLQRRSGFNYKGLKQNAGSFLKKIQKNKVRISDRDEKGGSENKKDSGAQSEVASFERNRKFLTENYLEILKKLEGTNIVKWRVLNTEIVG